MKRNLQIGIDTWKYTRVGLAAILLTWIFSAAVYVLYNLPAEPLIYNGVLTGLIGIVWFAVIFIRNRRKANAREQMIRSIFTEAGLPAADTLAESDYQQCILLLREELTKLNNENETRRQDEVDYYTTWVHQIKTPISVMRMELGGSDAENAQVLEGELFRIEQYVDMVLQYIRLGSDSHDLVIREYPLDELIRESIRKFAPQFVAKKLRLSYEGTNTLIITDKKWFTCILEQILSNAIKYTISGVIRISAECGVLNVSDTGIGIAPEDIPRIFEKGFTGENGRYDKRSSGLGLYLAKKAADMLSIPLSVESTVGKGSTFCLDLRDKTKAQSAEKASFPA